MLKRLLLLSAMSLLVPGSVMAQDARFPAVPSHGPIVPAPDSANQPDPTIRYRVVFNITKASADPTQPNPSIVKVARFLNLLATRSIRPAAGDIVAIVHGSATPLVMNDAAYRAKFKVANPNLPLIAALKGAGAQVHVCSQALHGNNIAVDTTAKDVQVDLAALTTLATLQLQGFALIPD
jgi:intracellular sulfur oxidation DsrE/DsrF family protein